MNTVLVVAALKMLIEALEAVPAPAAAPASAAAPKPRGRPPKAAAETPAAPAPSPAVADPFDSPTFGATIEGVRAALTALKDRTSQATAVDVLKKVGGADNLSSLSPAKYAEVIVAADAVLAPAPVASESEDPFSTDAPAAAPVTLEDVRAAVVNAQKRTAPATVQKVVMEHGGVANVAGKPPGPSLKALPEAQYAAVIAAVNNLPTTK